MLIAFLARLALAGACVLAFVAPAIRFPAEADERRKRSCAITLIVVWCIALSTTFNHWIPLPWVAATILGQFAIGMLYVQTITGRRE